MMFVLNLIFVHQSSLHPKYKQLCINGPFWAQELGRYIFYCDVLNLTFVYKTSLHPKHKRFILWALSTQGCGCYIFHCDLLNQSFVYQSSLHPKCRRLCLWAPWAQGWGGYIFCCDVMNLICVHQTSHTQHLRGFVLNPCVCREGTFSVIMFPTLHVHICKPRK